MARVAEFGTGTKVLLVSGPWQEFRRRCASLFAAERGVKGPRTG